MPSPCAAMRSSEPGVGMSNAHSSMGLRQVSNVAQDDMLWTFSVASDRCELTNDEVRTGMVVDQFCDEIVVEA